VRDHQQLQGAVTSGSIESTKSARRSALLRPSQFEGSRPLCGVRLRQTPRFRLPQARRRRGIE
jgi:hypothetical protein